MAGGGIGTFILYDRMIRLLFSKWIEPRRISSLPNAYDRSGEFSSEKKCSCMVTFSDLTVSRQPKRKSNKWKSPSESGGFCFASRWSICVSDDSITRNAHA